MISDKPLPTNWCEVALPEVAEINPPNPAVQVTDDTQVSFVPMAAVEALTGRLNASAVRPWHQVKKGYTRFQEGDVLFAKITPCMENGKAAISRALVGGVGAGSTEFHVLRPGAALRSEILLHYVLQQGFRKSARAQMTGTAGQLRVPTRFLNEQTIPVAPLPEQQRIVAAIESYLTRLDDIVATLERVQRNLKRYRASVLKAGVEGRLVPTEAELARAEGREYEPASVLLERILAERRRRWEKAELAKMEAKGKLPKNDKWKNEYEEPMPPDTTDLAELPRGWCWATVDQLMRIIDYRGRTPPYSAQGIPHLRSANIKNGAVIWENVRFVTPDTFEEFMTRGLPTEGDLLFTTEAPLGDVAFVPAGKFSLAQRLLILSPNRAALSPRFLYWQIMSSPFQARIRMSKTGSGVTGISSRNFKPRPVALAPLAEQVRIAGAIDQALAGCDHTASIAANSQARCRSLRQSILRWAFEGRLVNQDPTDFPASHLLECIRAERQASDGVKRKASERRKARTRTS